MNHLLADEQIRQFILNGFISVKTNLPDSTHEVIFEKSDRVFKRHEKLQNPGNNIMPEIPELYEVLEAPEVHGALTSLLGKDYILNTHRHCHENFPSENDHQSLKMGIHKDGHAGGIRPRHRVPRWAILFYCPQDCPIELGPTCVIPGSQYYEHLTKDNSLPGMDDVLPALSNGLYQLPDHSLLPTLAPTAGKKGTVWIMHFDIFHTVFTNHQDLARYGMKFVYTRTEEPSEPTWNNQDLTWRPPENNLVPYDQTMLWNYVWNWMCGKTDRNETDQTPSGNVSDWIKALDSYDPNIRIDAANQLGFFREQANESIPRLIEALSDPCEPFCRNAAYALAAIGKPSVPALVEKLNDDREAYIQSPLLYPKDAAHALSAIGKPAIPALRQAITKGEDHVRARAAYALGEMDSAAAESVPDLVHLARDNDQYLKRHAISALGMIKQPTDQIIPIISQAMEDWDEEEIGFYAAQAFQRLGPLAKDAIPVLTRGLRYGAPYVSGSCAEALTRIGTPEALRALTRYLRIMRWYDESPINKTILETPFEETKTLDPKSMASAINSAAKSQSIPLDPIREIVPLSYKGHNEVITIYFETGNKANITIENNVLRLYKKLRLEETTSDTVGASSAGDESPTGVGSYS